MGSLATSFVTQTATTSPTLTKCFKPQGTNSGHYSVPVAVPKLPSGSQRCRRWQKETLRRGAESALCRQASPRQHTRAQHSSWCHQRTQRGKETQPAVQDPVQNPLAPTGFNRFERDFNTQNKQEDPKKLKELTSRQEISVVTSHKIAPSHNTHGCKRFDHMDVRTLFSTSLYFLILLSLAGPIGSVSPTALAFFSLSRHAVKKAVHA